MQRLVIALTLALASAYVTASDTVRIDSRIVDRKSVV